ncbi:protein ALP1-like [Ixodes scapularis]
MYRNYKGTFSIVLMALVDSDLKFLYADVGRDGRMNDSGVWAATDLRARIARGIAEFPKAAQLPNSTKTAPFVIVGDETFGMKPYLMRPFPASELEDAERIFNYRLSLGRRIVENGFGILRNRFQVYGAPLRHKPDRAVKVVKATIALHNYLRTKNGTRARYTPPDSLDVEDVLTGTTTKLAAIEFPTMILWAASMAICLSAPLGMLRAQHSIIRPKLLHSSGCGGSLAAFKLSTAACSSTALFGAASSVRRQFFLEGGGADCTASSVGS